MAPKRKEIPPPPPKAADSSSDDEEEVASDRDNEEQSGEDEEESEEEVELPTPTPVKVTVHNPHADPDSEDESDSEEVDSEEVGSDSESDEEAAPKPLASMPPAPIRSKPPLSVAAPSPSKSRSGGKKPVVETKADDKEKAGKTSKEKDDGAVAKELGDEKPTGAGEQSGKKLFQRVYSEDDEIALVKGMLQFKEETGKNAVDDMNGFYDFVKCKIHVAVTKEQFVDKVRRLKTRFDNNAKRGKATFTKDHEQQLYDVSFQIWGSEVASGGTPDVAVNGGSKSGKKRKKAPEVSKTNDQNVVVVPAKKKMTLDQDASSMSLCLAEMIKSPGIIGAGVNEEFMKRGLHLLGEGVIAEYDAKWKCLLLGESEMYLRRVELVRELMKLTVDAVKASGQYF